jgi:hypothetical protein
MARGLEIIEKLFYFKSGHEPAVNCIKASFHFGIGAFFDAGLD